MSFLASLIYPLHLLILVLFSCSKKPKARSETSCCVGPTKPSASMERPRSPMPPMDKTQEAVTPKSGKNKKGKSAKSEKSQGDSNITAEREQTVDSKKDRGVLPEDKSQDSVRPTSKIVPKSQRHLKTLRTAPSENESSAVSSKASKKSETSRKSEKSREEVAI